MHNNYVCTYFPVASSVTDTQVTVNNPNVTSSAHFITVTCTIHPESNADVCVVMAVANNQVITSNDYVKSSYTLYSICTSTLL